MVVDPDKLVQLKNGIEEERNKIRDWLRVNRTRLRDIDPPGNDPCSIDTMFRMGQVGQEAIDACYAYVERLTSLIDKLDASAASYGLVEDDNANTLRRGFK